MKLKLPYENFVSSSNYSFKDELKRYKFDDIKINNLILNRGKCFVNIQNKTPSNEITTVGDRIIKSMFSTTLRKGAPTIDISMPYSGHYYMLEGNILFDGYLGVGQRLLDDNHPCFIETLHKLITHNVILRKEISTNDFVYSSGVIKTPQDVTELYTKEASRAFPKKAPYKAYLSSSGSEAIEASIKMASLYAHFKLIKKYGYDFEKKIMKQLGINDTLAKSV